MNNVASIVEYADEHNIILPCREEDPEVMFPDDDLPNDHEDVQAAKQVCLSCPLRGECAEGAIRRREPTGVWGALTLKERNARLRKHYRSLVQDEMLEVVM